jgi:hypothetical protein
MDDTSLAVPVLHLAKGKIKQEKIRTEKFS